MMSHSPSLRNRLIGIITVFAIGICVLNLTFLWGVTKWVEDFIFESLIEQEFARLYQHIEQEDALSFRPNAPFQLITDLADVDETWRTWLSALPLGTHEMEDQVSLLTRVGTGPRGEILYLVAQTDGLEYIQSNLLETSILAALLLLIAISAGLFVSLYFVRRLIDPLNRFTAKVATLVPDGTIQPLANDFKTTDELGTMARAFDRLQERLAAFISRERQFTSDVSHELRTPLAVASNATELLNQSIQTPAETKVVQRISRSLVKMNALVETFLAMARNENTQEKVENTVSLNSLIEGALEFHHHVHPQLEAHVSKQFDESFSLRGSSVLLSILVRNLIVNAIQYSSDQTVEISASPGKVVLQNSCHPAGPAQSSGAGIGLSIAKRVCETLGYTLRSVSKDDTFVVEIIL